LAQKGYAAAWWQAATQVAAAGLPGLSILCPVCKSKGALLSKWEPGGNEKPLHVVHSDGKEGFAACRLTREQAVAARSQARLTARDIRKTLSMGRPFVLFSGGRDSLCTLEYLRRLCNGREGALTAIHVDTTAGFPEVEEYVHATCRDLGVRLITVSPERTFFELAKKWGIPGVKARWCCETLKVAPLRRFLRTVDGAFVVYDGIRAAESPVRAKYTPVWFHPSFRCISVSPIFDWSDEKVDGYIKRCDLPTSPAANLGCSSECWCGAYKNRADFEKLLAVHADIFDQLVEVEKAQKGRFTFVYEKGKRVTLKSLRRDSRKSKLPRK
jgi:3'-phosphoadenosine 5'-phosphosulfate sulfotransferase (PAPS reductase)/FAD synthetase